MCLDQLDGKFIRLFIHPSFAGTFRRLPSQNTFPLCSHRVPITLTCVPSGNMQFKLRLGSISCYLLLKKCVNPQCLLEQNTNSVGEATCFCWSSNVPNCWAKILIFADRIRTNPSFLLVRCCMSARSQLLGEDPSIIWICCWLLFSHFQLVSIDAVHCEEVAMPFDRCTRGSRGGRFRKDLTNFQLI